jgi:hypothetical protein
MTIASDATTHTCVCDFSSACHVNFLPEPSGKRCTTNVGMVCACASTVPTSKLVYVRAKDLLLLRVCKDAYVGTRFAFAQTVPKENFVCKRKNFIVKTKRISGMVCACKHTRAKRSQVIFVYFSLAYYL